MYILGAVLLEKNEARTPRPESLKKTAAGLLEGRCNPPVPPPPVKRH
jgi:hypothetical protein